LQIQRQQIKKYLRWLKRFQRNSNMKIKEKKIYKETQKGKEKNQGSKSKIKRRKKKKKEQQNL